MTKGVAARDPPTAVGKNGRNGINGYQYNIYYGLNGKQYIDAFFIDNDGRL
jgi:hypothetical protein